MTKSYRHRSEGECYLEQYPKLQKWINQCVACGARGYEPSIPDQIKPFPTASTRNLKRFFPPLDIDKCGYCQTCRDLIAKEHES